MKELFNKLSNNFQFSKENRLVYRGKKRAGGKEKVIRELKKTDKIFSPSMLYYSIPEGKKAPAGVIKGMPKKMIEKVAARKAKKLKEKTPVEKGKEWLGKKQLKQKQLDLNKYVRNLHLPVKEMPLLVNAVLDYKPDLNIKTKAGHEFLRSCLKIYRESKGKKLWKEIIWDVEKAERKLLSLEKAKKDRRKAWKEFAKAEITKYEAREAYRKKKTQAAKEAAKDRYAEASLDYDEKQENLNLARLKETEIELRVALEDLSVARTKAEKVLGDLKEKRAFLPDVGLAEANLKNRKEEVKEREKYYKNARSKFFDRMRVVHGKFEKDLKTAKKEFAIAKKTKNEASEAYRKKKTRAAKEAAKDRYAEASLDYDEKQGNLKKAKINLETVYKEYSNFYEGGSQLRNSLYDALREARRTEKKLRITLRP